MGKLIGLLDKHVKRDDPRHEKRMGVLVCLIPILVFVIGFTFLLAVIHQYLGAIVWVVACAIVLKLMFAIKALETHTKPIKIKYCNNGDTDAARYKASRVVSRDVSKLDRPHLISCAAETVSENLVDSVLSPMFYCGIFGVPGAIFLRVSNTKDGMVGYLSEKHKYVGWCSAKPDDCTHYLVARLWYHSFFCH